MTKGEVRKLREVRKLLGDGFDGSDFSKFWSDGDSPLPTSEDDVNQFIEQRTKLWRESWILPVLDELIAKYSRD
jgi:hypothetical protein